MGPHQGRVEGKENLPRPAGHTPLYAPQDPIGLLGSQGTLLLTVSARVLTAPCINGSAALTVIRKNRNANLQVLLSVMSKASYNFHKILPSL